MSSTLKNNYTEQQLQTVKRLETVSEAVFSGSLMQRFNVDYYHEPPPIRLTDAYIQGKNHEHDHGRSLLKDFTKYLLISNIFNSEVYNALFSTCLQPLQVIHLQCMATSHTCCCSVIIVQTISVNLYVYSRNAQILTDKIDWLG